MTIRDLSVREWAVLGAVAEAPTHGFAIARLLADDGPLGQVWTVRRAEVYQALKRLVQLGLVQEGVTEPGQRGPDRTLMAASPAGAERLRQWLFDPVDHVRDVRSLLLLKLILLHRAGLDAMPLISAQRARLVPVVDGLERTAAAAEGFERVLAQWRLASCRATVDFLDQVVPGPGPIQDQ